jgi:hypothetical protein
VLDSYACDILRHGTCKSVIAVAAALTCTRSGLQRTCCAEESGEKKTWMNWPTSGPDEGSVCVITVAEGSRLHPCGHSGECAAHTEIGLNMDQYGSARHLSSWAGICPGNNESAGKHRSGKIPRGNKRLRAVLTECAWAAAHTKGSYFRSQYRRLVARRGQKRALVALGHTILTIVYHVIQDKLTYQELGEDFFDRLNAHRLSTYYVRRLQALG